MNQKSFSDKTFKHFGWRENIFLSGINDNKRKKKYR
jgi:hypothetical protein